MNQNGGGGGGGGDGGEGGEEAYMEMMEDFREKHAVEMLALEDTINELRREMMGQDDIMESKLKQVRRRCGLLTHAT